MSDGPYRSLPMRHACKRLAKRAQQIAFDPSQVAEAVCPALEAHWAAEVPKDLASHLREMCENRQPSLLDNNHHSALTVARRLTAGQGTLGAVLVDCIEQALSEGKTGENALGEAAHNALLERAVRDARTIEEHYYREVGVKKAAQVHARILDAILHAPIKALADHIFSHGASANRTPPKHDGLDEGVTLP
jgi:hypothetical protein